MNEKLVILVLLPLVSLTLFLGWAWLITSGKKSTKLSLRGLGLSIELTSVGHNPKPEKKGSP